MTKTLLTTLALAISSSLWASDNTVADACNTPMFGSQVCVFTPNMDKTAIKDKIRDIHDVQKYNQFGENRYALLFEPGDYGDIDLKLGYYTQAMGLGMNPSDVAVDTLTSENREFNTALLNFWRSAENFTVKEDSIWAVSQASTLRRLHFEGNLALSDTNCINGDWGCSNPGYASGGFMADVKVNDTVSPIMQQQFLLRNTSFGNWLNDSRGWTMAFVGTSTPITEDPNNANNPGYVNHVNQTATPVVAEKPFIHSDNGAFFLIVPEVIQESQGVSWPMQAAAFNAIPFINEADEELVYIVKPENNQQDIHDALAAGKHLLFTPGVYRLTETLHINNDDTVVLGIGFPTLAIEGTQPAITVGDNVHGVRMAGLIFDARQGNTSLLKIGETPNAESSDNPIVLHDIFGRVAAYLAEPDDSSYQHDASVENVVEINSNHVIVDHLWLWRADHRPQSPSNNYNDYNLPWDAYPAKNGLVVNGDDVTIYGLFVEHFQEYQTLWNGDNGSTYLYQSEIPYAVNQAWIDHEGYASYKLADQVTNHTAKGLGVYANFITDNAVLKSAIETPDRANINFEQMITLTLFDTRSSAGVENIINEQGASLFGNNKNARLDAWSGNN